MRCKLFIIPAALIFQVAGAQNNTVPSTVSQGSNEATATAPVAISGESIMDYKSVYDAGTLEEEVQMATERFSLTKSQQDVWLAAATDRRQVEKRAIEQLTSKDPNLSKDAMYKGLRSTQNEFYETIIGYLSPAQKNALETDRVIMEEKRKRLAKLPPPPPPAPTITVAPVDSSAIKKPEKIKSTGKKSKKKSKPGS